MRSFLNKIKGLTFKEFCMKAVNKISWQFQVYKMYGCCSPLVYNCRTYSDSEALRNFLQIISLPYVLFKCLFHKPKPAANREGLAVAAIAKNEGAYIKEWIEFYVKQGVSHFLIYDNDSTDNMYDVLQPFIAQGLVSYKKLTGKSQVRQNDAYNMVIDDYKDKFRYIAFLDLDEFCFCLEHDKNLYEFVDEFMKSHEQAGGIGANWLIFGSSGYETKPAGGVLKNFVMCAEKDFQKNLHIKTICDPQKVLCFLSPHRPDYIRGYCELDENGEVIKGSLTDEVSFNKIRVNHYWSKSKEEFLKKQARGRSDGGITRGMEEFYVHDQNIIKDTEILSHI